MVGLANEERWPGRRPIIRTSLSFLVEGMGSGAHIGSLISTVPCCKRPLCYSEKGFRNLASLKGNNARPPSAVVASAPFPKSPSPRLHVFLNMIDAWKCWRSKRKRLLKNFCPSLLGNNRMSKNCRERGFIGSFAQGCGNRFKARKKCDFDPHLITK